MASTADVTFALLRRDEQRKLEESARQAQRDTQKRSSKMGLGRLMGTVTGTLLGIALAPVTGGSSLYLTNALIAGVAGIGSRLGSEWGQQTTNIRETDVNKQKLFRDTARNLREDQFEAQRDLNRMANVRGLTDAFSVFSMAGTTGGLAVSKGAQAGGLSGAWQGGKAYAQNKIASLIGKETVLPTPTEALTSTVDPTSSTLTTGVPTPSDLTAGQTTAALGGSKIGTAMQSTMTGPMPLAPTASTAVGLNPNQLPTDRLMRQGVGIPGTGTVSVDQLFNRTKPIGGVNTGRIASGAGRSSGIWSDPSGISNTLNLGPAAAATPPVRSTMLQSAVEQSLPTAKKFAGSATQKRTLATTMGFNPNESLIKQMKKLGIDSSFSNMEKMWNQYLSGNIVSGAGAFPNTIPQSNYYGPLTPRR
jgi:hypothetical protein